MKFTKIVLLLMCVVVFQSCATKEKETLSTGNWLLASINNAPINKSNVLPTLSVDIEKMMLFGNGGCNNYSGSIKSITQGNISIGNIASTSKACVNRNIESDYYKALNTIKTYTVSGKELTFFDEDGSVVLLFLKQKEVLKETEKIVNKRLHDIWAVTQIDKKAIDKTAKTPSLEINLTTMKVMGNDGCNNFSGTINEVSDTKFVIDNLASTRKMCPNMDVVNNFNKAINSVISYKLDSLNLILLDANGKEVLKLLKVD
ncbi:META domain-containing protein [Tenacibaculum aquimarinum]|uniref:META domain-containing protein n=1 Tax=Tenacibaculum aquimarinum TaxID=2910675 RepID=UPI001F0AC5C7|nr:META domain-containing protein [Tenacibaculum aquimarinum]MCH3885586.1 META domain-containing protein [Tenacibaculum aquimarinum]